MYKVELRKVLRPVLNTCIKYGSRQVREKPQASGSPANAGIDQAHPGSALS